MLRQLFATAAVALAAISPAAAGEYKVMADLDNIEKQVASEKNPLALEGLKFPKVQAYVREVGKVDVDTAYVLLGSRFWYEGSRPVGGPISGDADVVCTASRQKAASLAVNSVVTVAEIRIVDVVKDQMGTRTRPVRVAIAQCSWS